ncbi:MAG TPA: AraC family transcriptional regulator ligand-binding domain-containing protein [Caulobacter sp.]|nr:AraC family transcriptional regulator ligand-binding domain-containing protein [Caulobacter sp.]
MALRLRRGTLRRMDDGPTLTQLPMAPGYFRLVLRRFGDTPRSRGAILEGTGVTEDLLRDSAAKISLSQQIRQVENVASLFGEGWALQSPELWSPSAHGPLGVAAMAAPDFAAMIEVVTKFCFVRAPFYRMSLRHGPIWSQIDLELAVRLDERFWLPLVEIIFVGIRAGMASLLAAQPLEARFSFACAEPAYAPKVRAVLGAAVTYGASRSSIAFPTAWLTLESPYADAALYGVAISELQAAKGRITAPLALRGRVERLLSTLPAGRLGAEDVARTMGVSRRTLVRRLAQAGAGYRELVDGELRGRAERFLRDGHLSHARIAEELGYVDPTSFSRACRRWFGGGPRRA